ncbi:nicotinate-nucleotide adenylyltransferase [Legionella sp. W05-934-2]|uniref:nicotinate-nucleotide adenylyltransferase n=1 Tax=Legionella sp. W05-934-2 TaxID=1198649 RepID=UPI0034635A97
MNNIVIFGGTFDPVHNGHIAMAEHVITDIKAEKCIWVPNKIPLLKNRAQASTQQRIDMLELAIQQSKQREKFFIDHCEINRQGPSFTVDTLRHFRNQFGQQQSLSALMGEDAFAQLNQWHEWKTIIQLAHIILVTRPKLASIWPDEITSFFNQHRCDNASLLNQQPSGLLFQLNLDIEVSSTIIRQHLAKHASLNDVCPKVVADYIVQNGLYR